MNSYQIKEEGISSYVKREVAKKMKMIAIIMTILLIAAFLFFYSYGVHKIIMPPMLAIQAVVLIFVYLMSLVQMQSMGLKTTFRISEKNVSVSLAKEKMSVVSQLIINRNEAKYGEKYDQSFPVHQIETTKIKANEIVIESYDYNFFTGNGKITIPKEMEQFNAVKKFILTHKAQFKVAS
ncbi:hypothetical protein [uncultured Kordia sp.]|uniref:hypothetical protein n=1 Tax=uncultured Kordia sp. TaxID=507699 RepID=UPI002633F8A8|nr:hypothetical protein [uncultured Kordia sp.]